MPDGSPKKLAVGAEILSSMPSGARIGVSVTESGPSGSWDGTRLASGPAGRVGGICLSSGEINYVRLLVRVGTTGAIGDASCGGNIRTCVRDTALLDFVRRVLWSFYSRFNHAYVSTAGKYLPRQGAGGRPGAFLSRRVVLSTHRISFMVADGACAACAS